MSKASAMAAFMNSPTSMTASSIHWAWDRPMLSRVASKLVPDHTPNTAMSRTRVSAAPRQLRWSRRWWESWETAKTKTRSKNSSSGETASRSTDCVGEVIASGRRAQR
jgi:hypothetical protein